MALARHWLGAVDDPIEVIEAIHRFCPGRAR